MTTQQGTHPPGRYSLAAALLATACAALIVGFVFVLSDELRTLAAVLLATGAAGAIIGAFGVARETNR